MRNSFRLSTPFEMRGIWWLPEQPENQVPGTLKYTPDGGLVLELDGHLQTVGGTQTVPLAVTHHELVLGTSNLGTHCTLVKATKRGFSINATNEITHTEVFTSEFAFFGQHFTAPGAIEFDDANIIFTSFTNWVNKHPFLTKVSENQSKHVVEYNEPNDISFPLHSEQVSVYVQIVHNLILNSTHGTSFLMEYRPHLRLFTDKTIQYQEYHSIIMHILKLLSFFVGRSVYVESIVARHPQSGNEVSIIYVQKHADYKSNIPHHKMILSLDDIHDYMQHVVVEWFNKYQLIKPTIDLFLGLMSIPKIYLEFKYLALVQAIESYHRATMDGKYMDDSIWKKLIPEIEASIPSHLTESHKSSLKSKIRYGNEYSLRKRLKEVIDSVGPSIRKMLHIYTTKETKVYVDRIVDTRNYYTHYSDNLKNIITPGELPAEVFRLWLLVYVIIAKEIGVPENIIESRLRARFD